MDILITMLFLWLLIKAVRLLLRTAWGVTKVIATVLTVVAGIALLAGIFFAGAAFLLVGALAIAMALLILRLFT